MAQKLHGLPGIVPNQTLKSDQPHDIAGASPERRRHTKNRTAAARDVAPSATHGRTQFIACRPTSGGAHQPIIARQQLGRVATSHDERRPTSGAMLRNDCASSGRNTRPARPRRATSGRRNGAVADLQALQRATVARSDARRRATKRGQRAGAQGDSNARALAGLPVVAPEESFVKAASNPSETLAFEFSTQADEGQAQGQDSDPWIVEIVEVDQGVVNIEEPSDGTGGHQVPNNGHHAPNNEHQAQEKEQPKDGQWTLERQAPEDEDQSQTDSSFGSSGRLYIHNEDIEDSFGRYSDPSLSESPTISGNFPVYDDATVHSLGPNPSSAANNNMDHQAKPVSSAALEPLDHPNLQFMDTTSKTLITLTDRVSYLDLTYARIRDDMYLTRHYTTQLRDQLTSAKTTMVRNYADSQQQLVDELALVKSQLVEMIDCIKELRDAKKGECGPKSKKSEDPSSKQGEGPSRQGEDSQQQLVDELALVKSQLVEMIECKKELGDAKKGESGPKSKKSEDHSSRQVEGPSRQGEGPSSTKGKRQ
ncbi:hypothetical protein F511_13777 [Dorcoceras hygrometricum]|uniref:Uncharacterized protein n=1 Tax=Dorcoceras hygrometricum TaxID=472368 RepID=A0A2Z7B4D2_9LAMI|nr:hypothetical protein F511_13777 [Dorcoceras hygrometricum]